jgi:hypothetical protein
MTSDFGKLASSGGIADNMEPETLLGALPNKVDGYGYLRACRTPSWTSGLSAATSATS